VAERFILAEATNADGRPKGNMRQKLKGLAGFGTGIQLALISREKTSPNRGIAQVAMT
jgi:hypothetical protein